MAKIIFLNFAAHGHTNPTLPLVSELVSRGEKVIYYSVDEFREKIEAAGAEFRVYGPNFDDLKRFRYERLSGLLRTLMEAAQRIMRTLPAVLEREAPDCLIHDAFAPWGRYLGDYLGVPAVSLVTTFAFNRESLKHSSRVVALPQFIFGLPDLLIGFRLKARLEKQFHVRKMSLVDSFMNKEGLNILFTSAAFHPHRELFDDSYRFVGPSFSGRAESDEEVIPAGETRPVVYISLGTMRDRPLRFFKLCFRALADLPLLVIVSVGNQYRIDDFTDVPDNFILKNYVPQLALLKRTAVFVTHCGMNSVHEALAAGVPLVAVPQTAEQALVADQVVKTGAGIRLRNITPAAIRGAVTRLLNDTGIRAVCRRLGDSLLSAGGSARAADEIREYMRRERQRSTPLAGS